MKLIAGLGNPGYRYKGTRHNAGFLIIEALAKTYKISLKKERGILSLSGKGRVNGCDVILAMPLTYMNLSGQAVVPLLKKYKINQQDLLVVCDDLDLELGRQKLKASGSSGGHRGLKSIADVLESQEFSRLRIGIGRPPHQLCNPLSLYYNWCGGRPVGENAAARYVLSRFTKEEKICMTLPSNLLGLGK